MALTEENENTRTSDMGNARNTYKYKFKIGNKVVHGGITNDLERREEEHQQEWPNGHIKQEGRAVTRESALRWEEEKGYSK